LRPGDRIVESQIAERMKVSKAPVREALRLLESSSLVSNIPNKGSFVVKLSGQDVIEIFGLRSAAEHLAVSLVSGRRDATVWDEMQAAVDAMRQAELQSDMERMWEADFRFHELLVLHSGNQRLIRLWSEMEGLVRMLVAQGDLHAIRAAGAAEHQTILQTIRDGDRAKTQSLLEEHIVSASHRLARILDR
ncbi:MAG: GntR family transcriptional regulator, partial [Chloroflexota bacterium]